jgi:hypothetical protein
MIPILAQLQTNAGSVIFDFFQKKNIMPSGQPGYEML